MHQRQILVGNPWDSQQQADHMADYHHSANFPGCLASNNDFQADHGVRYFQDLPKMVGILLDTRHGRTTSTFRLGTGQI